MRASIWVSGALLLGATPALAFDCAKSTTKVEKAICADRSLGAADADLTQAYETARAASSTSEKKMLALSQKRWIGGRESSCADAEDINTCIAGKTKERILLLQGAPESGPGYPSPLMPVFIQQTGTATTYDIDYSLLRFANPKTAGEKILNAAARKIIGDAPFGPNGQDASNGAVYDHMESFALAYASPDLISVTRVFYADEGGAHGNGGTTNINIDMRRGKEIKAADIFRDEALVTLTTECRDQILARKQENYGDEKYVAADDGNFQESTVADIVRDWEQWTIAAGKATVTFNSYDVGAYAEGPYECVFNMDKLKALAKPDAPLP